MSEPLDEDDLDFLDAVTGAKTLVTGMLAAVVEYPDAHVNSFRVKNQGGGIFSYFLGKRGKSSPYANNQRLQANIMEMLVHHRIAEKSREPNQAEGWLGFTEAAIAWHKEFGGPSPDEVRKQLGRHLRKQISTGVTPEFKVDEFAASLELRPEQVREQIRILLGVGLVRTELIGDNMEFGSLVLTQPDGILWAEAKYPPIYTRTSTTVNVHLNLRVEVQTIIEQARATEIPPEKLLEFEALMRRVEEELEKPTGQGHFQPVRDLVSTSADSVTLLAFVLPFLSGHLDKIKLLRDAVSSLPLL